MARSSSQPSKEYPNSHVRNSRRAPSSSRLDPRSTSHNLTNVQLLRFGGNRVEPRKRVDRFAVEESRHSCRSRIQNSIQQSLGGQDPAQITSRIERNGPTDSRRLRTRWSLRLNWNTGAENHPHPKLSCRPNKLTNSEIRTVKFHRGSCCNWNNRGKERVATAELVRPSGWTRIVRWKSKIVPRNFQKHLNRPVWPGRNKA